MRNTRSPQDSRTQAFREDGRAGYHRFPETGLLAPTMASPGRIAMTRSLPCAGNVLLRGGSVAAGVPANGFALNLVTGFGAGLRGRDFNVRNSGFFCFCVFLRCVLFLRRLVLPGLGSLACRGLSSLAPQLRQKVAR